jgi:hypothetical protein
MAHAGAKRMRAEGFKNKSRDDDYGLVSAFHVERLFILRDSLIPLKRW